MSTAAYKPTTIRHYTYWRILYTIYWKVDALCWTYGERFPWLERELYDPMWVLGETWGFLIPERWDV